MSTSLSIQHEEITEILLEPPRRQRVIVLAGPTAAGKSALGMMLAEALERGEIVSADSMQVYRGMNIGTAKPTAKELELVPHHLIDIRDVIEPFNVVDFYYAAHNACQEIIKRGGTPIIVGGSGFYIHALLYGPPTGPPSIPEVREQIESELDRVGAERLYEKLEKLDPEYAHTLTKHDRHKLVRALEIIAITGGKVSKLPWKKHARPQHYDFRCWFLHRPREILYHRLEKRCEKMLEAGLVEEVIELAKQGLIDNRSAAQAIGYRQVLEFLATEQHRDDQKRLLDEFQVASRHYAKRQFTWFRREPFFQWIDLDLHDPETVVDIIAQDFRAGK